MKHGDKIPDFSKQIQIALQWMLFLFRFLINKAVCYDEISIW